MKRKNNLYVAYVLTIALLLVLAACNGGNAPATAPTEEAAVPTVTDTPATVAEAPPTEEPAEESATEATAAEDNSEATSGASDDAYPEPQDNVDNANDDSTAGGGYPEAANGVAQPASEEEKPDDYVGPTPTPSFPVGPDFNIDEPIEAGATMVTGTGPVGLPVRLINVSEMGPLIAETVIDEDGKFTFEFETPLDDQISIGLKIGDLRDVDNEEGWEYDDFRVSPCYYERAFVGVLLDLTSIDQVSKPCLANK